MLPRLFIRIFAVLLFCAAWPVLADPPARVGRISYVSGQVSFRTDQDDDWTQASLNYPVTSHNDFATSDNSRLEIRAGSAAIRLDEDSELSVRRLDDDVIRISVTSGVASITIHSREARYPMEVFTPAGKVTLNGAGTYRFEASRNYDQTTIAALHGNAFLESNDDRVAIEDGRELIVDHVDPLEYSVHVVRQNSFDDWAYARNMRIDRSRSVRYVSPEIVGHEDLDEYGDWQEAPEYGAVWVPRTVVAGWAPYRHGRWAWVQPWGWTWVDYSPWGFAPFHYGRWVYFNNHWGWTPGVVAARPVYAPALVAFVGRPGWNVSFSFGTAPAVGWIPLGYYDLYRPGYPCSSNYVRNVNITNINVRNVNVTNVNWNNPPVPNYSLRRHPHAVTVIPQNAFANGKPVINQAAKFSGPVNEPVMRTGPRIPTPARRVLANTPTTQQGSAVTSAPNTKPAQQNHRENWRDSQPHSVYGGNNDTRQPQPRVRTDVNNQPDRHLGAPTKPGAHPGNEFRTSPAVPAGNRAPPSTYGSNGLYAVPPVSPIEPLRGQPQPVPNPVQTIPQQEQPRRWHPHVAPHESHQKFRQDQPDIHPAPEHSDRLSHQPKPAGEQNGVGRRLAEPQPDNRRGAHPARTGF
ncbi:MAG: DUF6600 domain-containing protein [Pseudomonadota bacterium]